jgi:hypothetical protein
MTLFGTWPSQDRDGDDDDDDDVDGELLVSEN